MSSSGRYVVLETDFSLHVSYDADHSVEVKVPSSYFNLVKRLVSACLRLEAIKRSVCIEGAHRAFTHVKVH